MRLPARPERILDAIRRAGHVTFEKPSPYDLNIFGIRSSSRVPNMFDDVLGCVYQDENLEWRLEMWPATTDPGLYWLEHYDASRVQGTAILVPGQYRNVYRLDMHAGKYLALCQRNGPVKVWRDRNRDQILDWGGPEFSGHYGINIHRSSAFGKSEAVGKWSAGCQVFQYLADFQRLLSLAAFQLAYHPSWTHYSYTLITEQDL